MTARRGRLIKRRSELGYSQEALAALIGADRTTIGRIERGETFPYPHTRNRLCAALRVTPEELDRLLASEEEAFSPIASPAPTDHLVALADSQPTGVLDMHRREILRLFSIAGASSALPPSFAGVDAEPLCELQRSGNLAHHSAFNVHLWEVFGLSTTKSLTFPLVKDQLFVLIDCMRDARSAAEHQRLCVLVCELFQLAGEILFDGNRYVDAAQCYSLAATAGREANAYDQWACALTRQAFVSIYDRQFREAASILDAAARVAAKGDSQLTTRHWVAAVQATTHASLGDLRGCENALANADRATERSGAVVPGGWLRFDGGRLAEERGTCYLALGRTDSAVDILTGALERTSSLRRRGSLLADLAAVGIRRRDVDEVLARGHAAADVAEQTRSSGYVGRKLGVLQGRLDPVASDSRVRALSDRITQIVAAQ